MAADRCCSSITVNWTCPRLHHSRSHYLPWRSSCVDRYLYSCDSLPGGAAVLAEESYLQRLEAMLWGTEGFPPWSLSRVSSCGSLFLACTHVTLNVYSNSNIFKFEYYEEYYEGCVFPSFQKFLNVFLEFTVCTPKLKGVCSRVFKSF